MRKNKETICVVCGPTSIDEQPIGSGNASPTQSTGNDNIHLPVADATSYKPRDNITRPTSADITTRMGDMLLAGWTMLNSACDECNVCVQRVTSLFFLPYRI
jgi:hypothetical protein